ncbi:MAG: hypothetical protein WBL23_17500, partial [Salinisphaera sp.]
MNQPGPSVSSGGALTLGCALLGLVGALLATWVFPLGAAEAASLSWLRGAAMPGMGWGELFRHVVARAASPAQPWLTLAAAAAVLKLVPALGALFALRLPDVLAAAVVAGALARLAGSRSTGILAALLFVASPVLWGTVAGTPGLVVDAAAAIVLYATMRESAVRPAPGVPLACLLAVVVLIGNGAGVYAIAIGLGVWLHTGLARGEWRLFASARLTALAGLVVAGLTLVNVLALPEWTRGLAFYRQLGVAMERGGLHVPIAIVAATVIAPSLVALAETVRRPGSAAGRLALILGVGVIVLFSAATTPPLAVTALAPILLLWWTAPLVSTNERAGAFWAAGFYVLAGLAAVAALLVVGRGEPAASTALVWLSRAAAVLLGLAAAVGLA